MEYKPLNHFRSEIRLVTIIPGEGSRIECTIKVVSLTLPPEYTALSYCWGNPKVTRDIYIGDHVLTVTTNLYAALMHLRLKDKPVTLWVDSICINQADISERNRQVSLMGVIYRKAKMTIAWLGESDDESHQCFDILEFLAWGLQDQAGNQFYHRLQLKNLKFQKLVKLFSRCYWIRSWIIQEVCLSQDVELVCGNRRLNWNVFSQALEYIQRDPELFTPEFRFPSSYYEHITMLKACREDMTGDVPLHFVDAVSRCRQSIATDPRDKVFSLLGLAYN
ncbi:HET-domain-containing protein, partial [Patellaria atrata CBS 101060]